VPKKYDLRPFSLGKINKIVLKIPRTKKKKKEKERGLNLLRRIYFIVFDTFSAEINRKVPIRCRRS